MNQQYRDAIRIQNRIITYRFVLLRILYIRRLYPEETGKSLDQIRDSLTHIVPHLKNLQTNIADLAIQDALQEINRLHGLATGTVEHLPNTTKTATTSSYLLDTQETIVDMPPEYPGQRNESETLPASTSIRQNTNQQHITDMVTIVELITKIKQQIRDERTIDSLNRLETATKSLIDENAQIETVRERLSNVTLLFNGDNFLEHDHLQQIATLYQKYSNRVIDYYNANISKFVAELKKYPNLIMSQSPSVRNALSHILQYPKNVGVIKISNAQYEDITNALVKATINIYGTMHGVRYTQPSPFTSPVIETDVTTDDENDTFEAMEIDVPQQQQKVRRKRKARTRSPTTSNEKRRAEIQSNIVEPPTIADVVTTDQTVIAPTPSSIPSYTAAEAVDRANFVDKTRQQYTSVASTSTPTLFRLVLNNVPDLQDQHLIYKPIDLMIPLDVNNYEHLFAMIKQMNLSVLDNNVHFQEILMPIAYYGATNESVVHCIWFVILSWRYFVQCAQNFTQIRLALAGQNFRDPDRVALYLIKYNYLYFYRQFISNILASKRTPFRNAKIENVIRTQDIVVQKTYNKLMFNFEKPAPNSERPIEPLVLLMAGNNE
uniref:Viral capsid associated protein 80 n=1 Tax=Helicoverpa armigera nucleopolyhedrovirus TaxID=51313 RepID=A0A0E3JA70_9ABAC|nr:viral capsid associated protein 80 [Helicoverpa armigera nucleopolyhedrovirus]AJP07514.1 viral capsid associated protein 80 [Helicoverpa armigera nucleopolyhedrovirus]